ncbi:MAG: phosphoenolpyruvate--protein phosphotransferase [Planctomycetes bacterium]|nr:phosphoenolpyruvate--protein phosphotransferase [Planctomycetota bacterium]
MEILRGISVAHGIAIGEAVILDAEEFRIPYRTVAPDHVEREMELLDHAFRSSLQELADQTQWLGEHLGQDAANVFDWHIGVLKDTNLRSSIEDLIRQKNAAAAYATSTVMRNYQRRFMQMTDPLLVERIRDVQDIERRLLRHVLGETREDLAHLSKPVVLVAHDLTPTQTAQLADTMVVGVALDSGAATSHTAILLRSWGRPGVIGLNDVSTRVSGGDLLIIDGVNQLVIANPNDQTLEEYKTKKAEYERLAVELEVIKKLDSVTADGVRIYLWSNIEFPREAAIGMASGADGVGLYRTEFLFLRPEGAPSEDEQYEAYRSAIEGTRGGTVTIRTFDLGADKYTQQKQYEQERNPMLGLRSIRYSLQNLDMFKVQLRAILRASVHGDVRLMFPLIVSLMEYRQAKMTLHDAMEDLEEDGIEFRRDVSVGMMLETPAAAIQVQDYCREVGFISIGTNDLIQYLLAVDRGNERVGRFFSASHPAVLRVVRDVIRACTKADVQVSLCGEMAGQPVYTLCLMGMGLRHFSMAPANVPEIKKLIRLATIPYAQRVVRRALSFETDWQVTNYLRKETKKLLPDDPI